MVQSVHQYLTRGDEHQSLLLAELLLASHWNFLSIIFLTYKMEEIMVTTIKSCYTCWMKQCVLGDIHQRAVDGMVVLAVVLAPL